MLTFNHFNFNVADLDKSLAFYKEALGLEPVGERKAAADGSFIIVYLGDGKTDFRLELTWLRDHPQKYEGSANSIWPSGQRTMRRPTPSMPPWAASALRILPWGSIL